ncbi:rhodanese-like domain-containing protein [Methanosphaerula palustris]|uniref:Rhodanese domain protein n=1 Tax=Methanosphaerula palustris (strain ATCC BAA-1556 / DSM 19958 / E1-9c) TaxID=521011 RepID=B8GDR4_METPE|nr:rhodanese-like domain-containing protein [Methanosphaerula palustris]ACL17415.1 Rhodanese domain protein [Methanosphaerula palustris E1-9c]
MEEIDQSGETGGELSPEKCRTLIQNKGDRCTIIDVRTRDEYDEGHLQGAINMDLLNGELSAGVNTLKKNIPYVVYCRRGNRGKKAMDLLQSAGFSEVYNISGGYEQWKAAGLPTIL